MARDNGSMLDTREVPTCLYHNEPRIRQALMPQRRVLRRRQLAYDVGLMFWFSRNRFVGSYLFFRATSRS
jgi:hypothetical protein